MADHNTALVTLLFTDIEGSTRLWDECPGDMREALHQHDELLRACIEGNGGQVFKTVGDAFCAAFVSPKNALEAVLAAQEWLPALALRGFPEARPLRVRMALHTGIVESRDGDYFGQPLNRIARLLAIGHGGQVLVSESTHALLRDDLPHQTALLDLGSHRLRDLERPERVFQVLNPLLTVEFPPLRSLENPDLKHNLPQQLTSFVGRDQQIAEIKQKLASTRLLTLTGSGGCGKTRLVLQIAADMLDEFRDGVWLVELDPLSDPDLVPSTVASVFHFKEDTGRPALDSLTSHLKEKQILLILDNCEHLLGACAKLADAVLRHCPWVVILATARESLAISGETTYRLLGLSLPDPSKRVSHEELVQSEAVRLFTERALQAQPSFLGNRSGG